MAEVNGPIRYSQAYYDSLKRFITTIQPKYGLEIGTEEGDSAEAFLEATKPWHGKLVCIDPQDVSYQRLQDKFGDRHIYIRGFSPEALDVVKQRKFDYVYVDGDHSYDAVLADLEAVDKLTVTGPIVCDDYMKYEVRQAVDKFAKEHDYTVRKIPDNPHGAVALWKQ